MYTTKDLSVTLLFIKILHIKLLFEVCYNKCMQLGSCFVLLNWELYIITEAVTTNAGDRNLDRRWSSV